MVLGSGGTRDGGGSSTLNSITAANGTNTIDSANNAQVWEWGTLTTQTAMSFTTSTLQGGTVVSMQNTAAASTSTGNVLSVTNATTAATTGAAIYSAMTGHGNGGAAGYFANTDTGSDTNYGVYASDSSASGYAGYF